MTSSRSHRTARTVAATVAVAGAAGLGLLAVPGGASAAPQLPPVSPQDLVGSVLSARPGPFAGAVEVDNELGLPALPNLPQAANGTTTARIWSDDTNGVHKGRVALPSDGGERDLITDGTTFWAWDSQDRTVTTGTRGAAGGTPATTDPQAAAKAALDMLGTTSTITVDGTAEVAGRPAYELVLAPKPTERTLLREVRIAVDSATRMPLRLTVLANGSTEPALQIGFSDLTFGPQDASLFTFTPPAGATVKTAPAPGSGAGTDGAIHPDHIKAGGDSTVVGDGWDRVLVSTTPSTATKDGAPNLEALGTPVSGAWGSGRLISTAVASAIITDDGRFAVGAVPEQVLTDALTK